MRKRDILIKIVVGIAAFLLFFGLIACNETLAQTEEEKTSFCEDSRIHIYVDDETGVNYVVFYESSKGGICPRYNADGTLYVDEGRE